ncbi:histone H1oo [Meleagris gallopavo]|uniref:histone H1oo n=1 Tax=Meleagris gallopavo TaxID=9103 RepID=UPI0009396DB0|nr:histone H1oo [Meleagris gallopavo]
MESQPAKAAGAARLSSLLARGRRSRHPPTLHMVLEALQAQDGKKGVSVVAIKRFILAKYPAVDPVRLKYLLKRALATGLSRGFLVRPHNSSALGATGRFKLGPKRLQQKQAPGREDPGEGPAPKTGRRGAAEAARAPAVVRSDGGQGTAKEKPKAVKRKPRAKPADAQPAVGKPGSDGAKAHQAPGKGRSQPPAAPAARGVREDSADRPAGAGVKRPKKTPAAKSKGEVPEEAQEAALKKGGKAKARKPQAALGAGQGGKTRAQEAATGRKVS